MNINRIRRGFDVRIRRGLEFGGADVKKILSADRRNIWRRIMAEIRHIEIEMAKATERGFR